MKKLLFIFIISFSIFTFQSCFSTLNSQSATVQKEIKIGNQLWMAENLNVDKFRNGDVIPEAKTEEDWKKAGIEGKPAWCYYDNDRKNGEKYGKLYNWYAVKDPRGLAPKGWHVSSDDEWSVLIDYLGGAEKPGLKLKSNSGWNEEGNGNNSSGFSGLPGGYRFVNGPFKSVGYYASWWSSTESSANIAWNRDVNSSNGNAYRYANDKRNGFYVRCIKD